MNTQDYEVPDYLRKPKIRQSERLWWIITLGAIAGAVLAIINSFIQMAYGSF